MKGSSLFLSMVLCLAMLALVISPVAPALAQVQSELVPGLEGQNFRDLGAYEGVEPGMIYRAGHLAALDEDEISAFEALGINRVIDLRTDGDKMRDGIEIIVHRDEHGNIIGAEFPPESFYFMAPGGTLDPNDPNTWPGHNDVHGALGTSIVPFNQGHALKDLVWSPPYHEMLGTDSRWNNILLWSLTWDVEAIDHEQWYVDLLENNKDAIKQVFDQLADPAQYPIVFHCTQGKDRAGVVSALLLDLLGVGTADIIEDYMATGYHMQGHIQEQMLGVAMVMYETINPASELYGLVPGVETFDDANARIAAWQKMNGVDKQYMINLLTHLGVTYGGTEAFLLSLGITPEQIVNIKGQLLPPNTPAGIGVTVDLDFGANVLFSWVTKAGYTGAFAQLNNPGGELPEGVQVVGAFVNVSTTATYAGPIIVGLNYPQGTPQPKKLTMYQWTGDNWEDVPTYVDPSTRTAYGMVNSLSWFFIGSK